MRIRRGIYDFVTLLVTSRQSHGAIGFVISIGLHLNRSDFQTNPKRE